MSNEKLQPFHKSLLSLLAHADAAEMKTLADLIHITLIPPSSYPEILKAWKRRREELKCSDHGITGRLSS